MRKRTYWMRNARMLRVLLRVHKDIILKIDSGGRGEMGYKNDFDT